MLEVIFPRKECRKYQEKYGEAELITRDEFDRHHQFHMFEDGPYKTKEIEEKQAYGKLKNGRIVYCELGDKMQEFVNEQIRK